MEMNIRLSHLEDRLNKYKMRVLIDQIPVDVDGIAAHVFATGSTEDAHAFFEEQYQLHPGASSTRKKHRLALNFLHEFSPSLPFGKLDYAFIKDFETWLLSQPNRMHKGRKLSQNYVNNTLSCLQYYTNEAIRRKLITLDPFAGFKRRKTPAKVAHLTLSEVERIAEVDLSHRRKSIQQTRDVFVFACYAGLRFQDLFYLRVQDIHRTENGVIMVVDPKKTKNSTLATVQANLTQVFEGRAIPILEKYVAGKEPHETVFGPRNPETHNSDFNKHLKAIAKEAGIESKVTAHVSRHTCAMILLNVYKWRLAEIKTYLGHSDIGTTQRYAKAVYRM